MFLKHDHKFFDALPLRTMDYIPFPGAWVYLWLLKPIECGRSDNRWFSRLGHIGPCMWLPPCSLFLIPESPYKKPDYLGHHAGETTHRGSDQ